MKRAILAAIVAASIVTPLSIQSADAKGHGTSSCDGFHRCRCGVTAARHHGLPLSYNGRNLKMASEWAHAFPRTSFHIGVVGVKPHHVLTVTGGDSCANATVYDDAGTYQRNVCHMIFVDPHGNRAAALSLQHPSY